MFFMLCFALILALPFLSFHRQLSPPLRKHCRSLLAIKKNKPFDMYQSNFVFQLKNMNSICDPFHRIF